jgi:2-keto-4-pentenoate hydratase/2-oxohepta-3-ene-1,7-dioic acid hydratase in catechol pathway
MQSEVPSEPVIFLKPASAVIPDGGSILLPSFSRDVHHEVELVVAIGRPGRRIDAGRAYEHVAGYAIGLDMTARDVQAAAKKKGLPWSVAKGFDTSAPVSRIVPAARIPDPHALTISCSVNAAQRQRSSTGMMIFSVPKMIAYISSIFTLEEGDLIFTGTPEGVGPVVAGDVITAEIEGHVAITVSVSAAA